MSIKNNTISLQEILESINTLPDAGGVELPELTNEGTASDLLAGKQLIDQEGNIVEGTITTKTSSNLTASGATVTVPSGYYASQATKNVTTATQATPSITVDANGLITATATQAAGYVAAGTKSGTKQLAFQPAKTITPSTASQIAVSSGYYTGGNITVAGDSNLVAGNIKSGVSIFGVSGTLVEGGGEAAEWSENEDAIISRAISNYTNDRVTTIGSNAFRYCSNLTTVNFPMATTIGDYAFHQCSKLTTVNFPAATTIGDYAFNFCPSLTTVSFPAATAINENAFYQCYNLTTVSCPKATIICNYAFSGCGNLTNIILAGTKIPRLENSNAFSGTGYSRGYFYVPSSMITSYQTATNWAYFSSRFSAIETYPDWDGNYGTFDDEIVTFTINGEEHQGEPTMIWAEWCDSDYNTIGLEYNSVEVGIPGFFPGLYEPLVYGE